MVIALETGLMQDGWPQIAELSCDHSSRKIPAHSWPRVVIQCPKPTRWKPIPKVSAQNAPVCGSSNTTGSQALLSVGTEAWGVAGSVGSGLKYFGVPSQQLKPERIKW